MTRNLKRFFDDGLTFFTRQRRAWVVMMGLVFSTPVISGKTAWDYVHQEKEHPVTSYLLEEGNTRGFTSLTLNYPFVRERMINDIRDGKANAWAAWLKPGTDRSYSLYWWMLAEWHHAQGHSNQAYQAAMQATVFGQLELTGCAVSQQNMQRMNDALLMVHRELLQYKPSQQEIRESMLDTITRTERFLAQKKQLSSQACYRFYTLQGPIPSKDLAKRWQNKIRPAEALVMQQRKLDNIKRAWGYQKVVQASTMNQLWISKQQAPPK